MAPASSDPVRDPETFAEPDVARALRDSEALYESLVQSLPQNVFRKDRDGRITFVNRRYCVALGRSFDELLGKTDFDLFPRELAEKYVHDDREVMAAGRTLEVTERHRLPDGRTIHVHVVKTPVFDAGGQVIGVQGIFWDVTEQVDAEESLARSERRYRQLAEATMDGIIVVDAAGRVTLFNPAAERLFGYRRAEVIGQPATLLIPEEFKILCATDGRESMQMRLFRALGHPVECQARRKDGGVFPVEVALSALGDTEADFGYLAAVRDLTERHKMRAVLLQNEKLASIGLLSAGIAHEINNPLAFVTNNLVVLERDCAGLLELVQLYDGIRDRLAALDPALATRAAALAETVDLPYVAANLGRVLRRTRDGVERVTRIIHSLRGLARTDAPRSQEARIPDLVAGSLELLQARFQHLGVTVEQHHDSDTTIACVATQLSQVILNLLVNAFQAIEATGRSSGRVTVRSRRRGEEMLLEVCDDGCGIAAEILPRLFDPFFTTKEVGEGIGLGLAISHHIVEAHGGRIEVVSEPGRGACFRVMLPLRGKTDRA